MSAIGGHGETEFHLVSAHGLYDVRRHEFRNGFNYRYHHRVAKLLVGSRVRDGDLVRLSRTIRISDPSL